MRLPRDVSGRMLITALKPLGYKVVRQVGSHIRLTTSQNGKHHILTRAKKKYSIYFEDKFSRNFK